MKRIFFTLLMTFSIQASIAQIEVYDSTMFLNIYPFSSEIESELAKDNDSKGAALEYGRIGQYKQMLTKWDKGESTNFVFPEDDSTAFLNYAPTYAKDYIIKRAKQEKVVMINEAPHNPLHRAFIHSMLKDLYDLGFRYYAVEGLSKKDVELTERGYPMRRITGRYTDEPLKGDLVRQALAMGFTVVPYDGYQANCTKQYDSQYCMQLREDKQAENLAAIIENDAKAKILVHASYGHIDERPNAKIKMMAARFRELTGINPMTIDQDYMNEHSEKKYEDPIYKMAADLFQIKSPSVFMKEGEMYHINSDYCDILVFHPRTRYKGSRPVWLRLANRSEFPLKKSKLSPNRHYLVQAFPKGENTYYAVPIDQFEVNNPTQAYNLMLPSGVYQVVILDEQRNIADQFEVDIK